MADAEENCQKPTIVGALVESGKKTLEIGGKILDQVKMELGELAVFQTEHDECLSNLVNSAKAMGENQQSLASRVLSTSFDNKQYQKWLSTYKNKLQKMQEEFDAGENEYFVIQEKISALKSEQRIKKLELEELRGKRIQKSVSPTLTTPTTTPKQVIRKHSILKQNTPKRKTKRLAQTSLPPPKKTPRKQIPQLMDKTMDTDYDDDDSFWCD